MWQLISSKRGARTWTPPNPFLLCLPPPENNGQKAGQEGGRGTNTLIRGRRGKEPFLRNTDESIRAILAPNVCNQPPPDILKSDFYSVDYQLPNKEDVTDKPVEERILQALSYTL